MDDNVPAAGGGMTPATLIVAASNSLHPERADYKCDGTADETEINQAIATLTSGGRVVLLEGTYTLGNSISIQLDNITLEGQGAGTIIGGAIATHYIHIGNASTNLSGIHIKNLQINGTGQTGADKVGIYFEGGFDGTEYKIIDSSVSHCKIKNTIDDGIWNKWTRGLLITNNHFESTGAYGVHPFNFAHNTIITNNVFKSTGTSGIGINADWCVISNNYFGDISSYQAILLSASVHTNITDNVMYNCLAGIYSVTSHDCVIIGNIINNNIAYGIKLNNSDRNVVNGNTFKNDNTQNLSNYSEIEIDGGSTHNIISNNSIYSDDVNKQPVYGIKEFTATDDYNSISGNIINGMETGDFLIQGSHTQVVNNPNASVIDERKFFNMKNTSGGALAIGDTVILKAVAAGNEITTTVNQGDDNVFGEVTEVIADNVFGLVRTLGKTTSLKVNGTAAIAIGNHIGTFTAAGIGMRAAAGDMAIAIALEAYAVADSAGVINALLITPRKI